MKILLDEYNERFLLGEKNKVFYQINKDELIDTKTFDLIKIQKIQKFIKINTEETLSYLNLTELNTLRDSLEKIFSKYIFISKNGITINKKEKDIFEKISLYSIQKEHNYKSEIERKKSTDILKKIVEKDKEEKSDVEICDNYFKIGNTYYKYKFITYIKKTNDENEITIGVNGKEFFYYLKKEEIKKIINKYIEYEEGF